MKRLQPFYFTLTNERERAEYLEAGIDLPKGKMTGSREFVRFDIAEDDPRWDSFLRLFRKFGLAELNNRAAKSEPPTPERKVPIAGDDKWLNGYSGQSVDELIELEGKCRTDSLVLAFEEAISQKAEKNNQRLSDTEHVVLGVEALEREVNNGGYDQFFTNSSREFASSIVDSLRRIGCNKTAMVTQRAIKVLGVSDLTAETIETVMAEDDEQRLAKLNRCDDSYHKNAEPIADRLFAFIKANKGNITF